MLRYSTPQHTPPMSPLRGNGPLTPRTPIGGALFPDNHLPPPSPRPPITLTAPPSSKKKRRRGASTRAGSLRAIRAVRALFRSLPILASPTACRLSFPHHSSLGLPRPSSRARASAHHDGHVSGASRTTGTLFGHRRARVTLAVQETPGSVPILLLELAMQTGRFMQEMGAEHLRVALECDKKPPGAPGAGIGRTRLLDEPLWTAYVNGRKIGYAVRREPTEDDLTVMQLLRTVSVGAGVLPSDVMGGAGCAQGQADAGDLAYMRARFDRVVGSRDSESLYMLNPDGNNGPELSIFFIRI
ncbi:protein MIZU-KUSSEI 1 [Brachypodium distachyon]|uniref:Protein MIZU-KUSSEI 1 n=1 Tax=Brachypodium distachyon TaxID=15368 RepID=A0A0Q3GIM3_BRADI|nr:protein MIZU-KUSSEI 1 [Brachypodium distachyon]KQK10229.1 hypothetical protein BRADI_2g52820v3 [Brachypodium distachyon]|eukprot:XP_014754378.1 protein MIZU-KUSSEI 1 [Brachypodium distachyon]